MGLEGRRLLAGRKPGTALGDAFVEALDNKLGLDTDDEEQVAQVQSPRIDRSEDRKRAQIDAA